VRRPLTRGRGSKRVATDKHSPTTIVARSHAGVDRNRVIGAGRRRVAVAHSHAGVDRNGPDRVGDTIDQVARSHAGVDRNGPDRVGDTIDQSRPLTRGRGSKRRRDANNGFRNKVARSHAGVDRNN